MKRTINGRAWQGDAEALNALERSVTETKQRRESVPPEELDGALETITDYLKTGWSTGGGRRLRQFVWSLWNGHHLINLFDLSSGLDNRLTDAAIIVFRAAMLDALGEQQKRGVLEKSGEFARWEAGPRCNSRGRAGDVSAAPTRRRGPPQAGLFRRAMRQTL